jgi:hypothetical protein
MGREAICHCEWGDEAAECKVLLEGPELIVRLGIRRRVPVSSLTEISTVGQNLVFRVGREVVKLRLGAEQAHRWAKAIATPLPSLAGKLGISNAATLRLVGSVQSEELQAALGEASLVQEKGAEITVLCVQSQADLHQPFEFKSVSGALWVVYPKGTGSEVKESAVRALLREHGFIDTKVVSVSARFTALRFTRNKAKG